MIACRDPCAECHAFRRAAPPRTNGLRRAAPRVPWGRHRRSRSSGAGLRRGRRRQDRTRPPFLRWVSRRRRGFSGERVTRCTRRGHSVRSSTWRLRRVAGSQDVVEAGDKPHAVFAALVEELAARRPTIAVLEDLHWADEATLDVAAVFSAAGSEPSRALVVVTYRDDELDRWPSTPARARRGRQVSGGAAAPAARALGHGRGGARGATPCRCRGSASPYGGQPVLRDGGPRGRRGASIPPTVVDAVLARAGARVARGTTACSRRWRSFRRAWRWICSAPSQGRASRISTSASPRACSRSRPRRSRVPARAGPTGDRGLDRPAPNAPGLHRDALRAIARERRRRLATWRDSRITPRRAGDVDAVLRVRACRGTCGRPPSGRTARPPRSTREHSGYADRLSFTRARATCWSAARYECYVTDQLDEAIEAARRWPLECHRERRRQARGGATPCASCSELMWCPGRIGARPSKPVIEAVTLLEGLPPGPRAGPRVRAASRTLRMHADDAQGGAGVWADRALELGERARRGRRSIAHALGNDRCRSS